MEFIDESYHNLYEVEKIINCKSYKNKKFYLINGFSIQLMSLPGSLNQI